MSSMQYGQPKKMAGKSEQVGTLAISWSKTKWAHRLLAKNGTPNGEKVRYFYALPALQLPVEAPHDAALQPQTALRSAAEMRVKILDLDQSERNVTR
jgi:hypothetical protein